MASAVDEADRIEVWRPIFRHLIVGRPPQYVRNRKAGGCGSDDRSRSEEHTSELQSLMRTSYALLCLKKNNNSLIPHPLPPTTKNLTTDTNNSANRHIHIFTHP